MKISVYITSYNQKRYLIEAIESVLNQTLKPFEVIVVDDCSTDGSQAVIAGYAARYPDLIKPIYHTQNLGAAQSRVDALQVVNGEYVTYVDGDDRFLPTKLEKEANLLCENPDAKIAFSNNYYVTSDDSTYLWVWADDEKPPQGNVFCQTFAYNFPRNSIFRMELTQYRAWKRIGFQDTNLIAYDDFDMRIRLAKHYRVAYWDEPLSEIRVHSTGLSHSKAALHMAELEYIYHKNRHLLNDLSVSERKYVRQRMGRVIAKWARRAVGETLKEDQYQLSSRVQAFRYYLNALRYHPEYSDYKLLLWILLPQRSYGWLKTRSHKVQGSW